MTAETLPDMPRRVAELVGVDTTSAHADATALVSARLALGAMASGTQKGAGKKTLPVKYRNPMTGETWSGRGLQPKWLKVALADGKTLADFAVNGGEE